MNKTFHYFLCISLIVFLTQCRTADNTAIPDVSDIEVYSKIDRFEASLFSLNDLPADKIPEELNALKESYPNFFDFYAESLMSLYKSDVPAEIKKTKVLSFISDTSINELVDSCLKRYPNLDELESELNQAFRYYHHYFPYRKTPKFISYVGGFGPAAITLDSIIVGVNLDMHLGADMKHYDFLGFPKYQSAKFEPEYMAINMLKVYGNQLVPENSRQRKLIDHMVRQGKVLYFLDKVLPKHADHMIMGYTKEQLEWCRKNESDVWAFFIENDMLFSSKRQQFLKYVNDGPTSSGMPADSPGNIGSWLGWQIVNSYAKNNPDLGLEDIMGLEGGEEILRRSRYKPRKT